MCVELERLEPLDSRPLVHNYGHGGAGITLAFGCAEETVELMSAALRPPADVVVLGSGMVGLTSALRLSEAGFGVRVLARDFPPDTTSDVAGGQFAPSLVARGNPQRHERWVRRSYAALELLAGSEFGIHRRPNYATRGHGAGLRRLPRDLCPLEELDTLPFPGRARRGFVVQTWLIEPPILLPRLVHELQERGVTLERSSIEHLEQIRALRTDGWVNALGLGAGALFGDNRVSPIRGQLVHVEPQDLPYLLSHSGYLFPRSDALVLGGTAERGERDPQPESAACARILANHRGFFAI